MCAALVAASNDVCIMSDGYCCKVHDFGNRELNIGVSRVTFMTGKKTMFTSYIYLSHNTQPSMIHKLKISVMNATDLTFSHLIMSVHIQQRL